MTSSAPLVTINSTVAADSWVLFCFAAAPAAFNHHRFSSSTAVLSTCHLHGPCLPQQVVV